MPTPSSIGYIALLRRNRAFRRLWYGQIVSQLGDWLDSIALFTLLLKLTGSGQALGLLLVAEFLPATLISPFAGVIIDRLPRKTVMVLSDIGRALLVLGLLFVNEPGDIWLIYVVIVLKVGLAAFFEPARSAIIPGLTKPEELITANGLSGATWSAMLALGAALGGLVVGFLGTQAAFILDSISFLLSAYLIASIPVATSSRQGAASEQQTSNTSTLPMVYRLVASGLREFVEGLRFILRQRDIVLYTFTKGLWSLGGGVLLLLTLYGRDIFPLGRDGALSIGLFYAARGVGAGLGPWLVQRLGGDSVTFLRRAVGPAIALTGLGYLALSGSNILAVALLTVLLAHMGGSTQWVFSTALLQIHVPDRLRGRVFAVEYAAMMLTTALSSYLTGLAHDTGWPTRALTLTLAAIFITVGCGMTLVLWGKRTVEYLIRNP